MGSRRRDLILRAVSTPPSVATINTKVHDIGYDGDRSAPQSISIIAYENLRRQRDSVFASSTPPTVVRVRHRGDLCHRGKMELSNAVRPSCYNNEPGPSLWTLITPLVQNVLRFLRDRFMRSSPVSPLKRIQVSRVLYVLNRCRSVMSTCGSTDHSDNLPIFDGNVASFSTIHYGGSKLPLIFTIQ